MARWKARGRLYIRRNWTFFAISYGWDVMSGNRSKSAFFEWGWVTLIADFRGKGALSTNHCWCQKTRVIAVSCGIKISAVLHLVLSQYTRVTDEQTERRTEQDRPRICSRGIKIGTLCGIFSAIYVPLTTENSDNLEIRIGQGHWKLHQ